MTYSVQKQRFETEDALLVFLGSLSFTPGESVGMVAGHFMLMYDDQAECLVPMIHQDATNPKVSSFSKEMAGAFPLRTFKLGVRLVKAYLAAGIDSKLILIVNDHIFQTLGWSLQGLQDRSRSGTLRHDFYRQKHPLPKAFFHELTAAGLTTETLLDNNNPARTPNDILPKTTRLYSEQALRNYFDQHTRIALREMSMFREVPASGSKTKLMFIGESGYDSLCLTENYGCGCSGELIQFFLQLSSRSLSTLIFFVPDECKRAADVGVKAFLNMTQSSGRLINIFVVSGFGGMGIDTASGSIHLAHHRLLNS